MVETLIAALSALFALGAGLVSYWSYRHQVRRATVTDARQQRIDQRERTVSQREAAAERREVLAQASMLDVTIRRVPSSLREGWSTSYILVHNSSNQPVSHLNVRFRDEVVTGESGVLFPGSTHSFRLTASEDCSSVLEDGRDVSVDFTDAAGIRWRREGDGGLREGRSTGSAWEWGAREEPVIMRFTGRDWDQPLAPEPASPRARDGLWKPSCAWGVLIGLLALALLVTALLRNV
ncbi:hypothetical protein ACFY97_13160 [Streptomyces klenkii]|uniref:hypothetical protein n=1 Tax=Streptomyces klenkii TaxID=1420899 RepID=UPI0036E4B11E